MLKSLIGGIAALLMLAGSTAAPARQTEQADPIAVIADIAEAAYGGDEAGAAISIVENGELIWAEGFGMADLEWQIPVTPYTSFRIGSVSKPFTALAVLQLVEAGRVGLDAQISTYLPDLPGQLGRPTVRQLLDHTSGLPDHFALPEIPSIMRNPIAPEAIVAMMADAALQFEPGSRRSYSNFNYVLLGLLVEAMDPQGRDYGTYVEEEIFAPLAMTDSHYDRQSVVIARRARGYDHDGNGPVNTITAETSLAYAAGALMSSASDLALFTNALRSGRLLGDRMRDAAWTATILPDGSDTGYGLGFNVTEFLGERVIWHSGSVNGFQATWMYLPESDRAVAVLSNGYYRPNTTTMARRILATLAGLTIPDLAPVGASDDDLADFEGRYALGDGRVLQLHVQDGARFNLDGGPWRELAYAGNGLFYRPDTLNHFRIVATDDDGESRLDYMSATLEPSDGRRVPGAIEGAEIAVPLDHEQAERIAGDWAIASGDIFAIRYADGALSLHLPGQPGRRLHGRADGSYFVRGMPITVAFAPDGQSARIDLYGTEMALQRQ